MISRLSYQFANLGYEVNNQYWGQGFASEAIEAAIPTAFKTLLLHRVEAGILPKNRASIRVAKKVGLRREGLRKKYFFDGQEWIDIVYFVAYPEDIGLKSGKPKIKPEMKDYF